MCLDAEPTVARIAEIHRHGAEEGRVEKQAGLCGCHPSTWKGRGQPGLHSEFESSLGYIANPSLGYIAWPCLKKGGVHCVVMFTQDQVQAHGLLQARVNGSLRVREGLGEDPD